MTELTAGLLVSVSRSFRCDSIPRDLYLIHRINEKGMVHGPGERFLATFVDQIVPKDRVPRNAYGPEKRATADHASCMDTPETIGTEDVKSGLKCG